MKNIISVILTCLLIIEPIEVTDSAISDYMKPMQVAAASNNESVWDGTEKTKVNPNNNVYVIDTAAKLAWFASEVNANVDFSGTTIIITGNMDLDNQPWTPIGCGKNKKILDAAVRIVDCKIKNLNSNSGVFGYWGDDCGSGLFGTLTVSDFEVDNLQISNSQITTVEKGSAGLLAGMLTIPENGKVKIKNSTFSGNVSSVINFFASGTIGGIFGCLRMRGENADIIFENIIANVTGKDKYILGGIVGMIDNTNNYGKIAMTNLKLDVDWTANGGNGYAGGVIGVLEGGNVKISLCSVKGNIRSSGYTGWCGGLIAHATYNILQIENSYVMATLESSFTGWWGAKYLAAGFLDYSSCGNYEESYIKNCYVSGKMGSAVAFVSHNSSDDDVIPLMHCYFDKLVTGLKDNEMVCSGSYNNPLLSGFIDCVAYTTDEMKNKGNYVDWDFNEVWFLKLGQYPVLRVQDNTHLIIENDYVQDGITYAYDNATDSVYVKKCEKNVSGEAYILNDVYGIPVTKIGIGAFVDCKKILGLYVSDNAVEIEDQAFDGCRNLQKIYLPACMDKIAGDISLGSPQLSVYGYRGTYAQSYAEEHNIHFVARYETPENIVDYVSEYTSDGLYAQYDKIKNSEYSAETKHQLYQELFSAYGILDVSEGIEYLSNTVDKRWAYMKLVTDDLYTSSLFYNQLNSLAGFPLRAVLLADGLIFNGEVNDWIDFSTYTEADYPGVSKYKAMLYDFMDVTSTSIEFQSDIKLVSDVSKNVTGAAKVKADNLIKKLNECQTIEQEKTLIHSAEAMDVWLTLAEDKDSAGNFVKDGKGNIKLIYELDEASGFGQFAKAMGYATETLSIVNMGITDALDLLTLDSKLAIFVQYRSFLQDVVSHTGKIPFQLRWAASQILDELNEGYYDKIESIVFEILEKGKLDSTVFKMIVGETTAASISSWLGVIGIESFFINQIVDIGSMVKDEACVEGYAALATAFTKNLEKAKQDFLLDKTEENAWNFYYNYNILYRLRYKGEQASLKMHNIKGFIQHFNDLGYSEKQIEIKETLKMLEECKFTLCSAVEIPESLQYVSKAVIQCPVDVSVFAEDGTLIEQLKDGEKKDVTNEYGRFAVVYNHCTEDYAKIICLNTEQNVTIQLTGIDDGLVNMKYEQSSNAGKIYEFSNVPITKGDIFQTSVKQIINEQKYDIDVTGNGVLDDTGSFEVKTDTYIPVESVKLSNDELSLSIGETAIVDVSIQPDNTTIKDLSWVSADSSIATVSDGKITALSEGTVKIYCSPLDATEKRAICNLKVVNRKEPETENKKIEKISLVSASATLNDTDNATLQLKAIIYPENILNNKLKWSSDNESVAKVDSEGLVTALSVGQATITVASIDDSDIFASCVITVKKSDNITPPDDGNDIGDNTGGNDSNNGNGGDNNSTDDNTSGGGTTGGNTSGGGSSGGGSSGGGTADGNTSGGGSSGGDTTGGNASGNGSSGGNSSSGGTGSNSSGGNSSGNDTDNSNGNQSGDNDKPDDSMQIKLLYYIIEFNANAGTKLSRKTMTLLNDDNLGILPKVQREDYIFNGWYTQKSGGTKVSSSTILNAGTTLFAQWIKVNKPSKVKATSLKSKKTGQLAVSFKKITGAKGYEIAYSTNKKFPSSSTKKIVSASLKKTLKKLKSGRKYYIRIRAYKVDSTGKKVYGAYSKAKSMKIK